MPRGKFCVIDCHITNLQKRADLTYMSVGERLARVHSCILNRLPSED